MANRTIQFFGLAYGSTPATLTATADGSAVFSGSLTTLDQPVPTLPNLDLTDTTGLLFGLELDTAFSGNVAVSCQVTNGVVIFAQTQCNYVAIANPIYTPAQVSTLVSRTNNRAEKVAIYKSVEAVPPLSAEDTAVLDNPASTWEQINTILEAHNLTSAVNGGAGAWRVMDPDPRVSVLIDGVPQDATPTPTEDGIWWWEVSSGSTLSFTLQVPENL
jgi:hypothetical protein